MPAFNVPGYRYLGPGNKLNNGTPINSADSIARDHDIAYEQAKSTSDIRAADRKAIGQFIGDKSIGGTIGAVGLGVKYIGESIVGVQYPNMSKRMKPDSSSEVEMSSVPADNKQDLIGNVPVMNNSTSKNAPLTTSARVTFKKTHMIQCESFKWARYSGDDWSLYNATDNGTCRDSSGYNITTSLQVIDPNVFPLYMTNSEYMNLPVGSYAIRSKIRLTPIGYRLPFPTGDDKSTYANSQTLIQVGHAIGLENMMPVTVASYTSTEADPVHIATQIQCNYPKELAQKLLGLSAPSPADLGGAYGIPRHVNAYAVIGLPGNKDVMLNQYMAVENANDVRGQTITDYSYEFKNGMIKPPSNWTTSFLAGAAGSNGGAYVDIGFKGQPTRRMQSLASTNIYDVPNFISPPNFGYYHSIEKSPTFQVIVGNEQSPKYPSRIYFGGMAVQSNPVTSPTPTFVSCVHTYKLETELEVFVPFSPLTINEFHYPLTYYDPVLVDPKASYWTANRFAGKALRYRADTRKEEAQEKQKTVIN